ncbi:unnamed protein product [Diabrotica balteata]|uniref:Dscam n=1 Tax=Diabrotica balteata TaxID=107213 RepID=A0A9N9XIA1_DIABA|nr:unnamed protein product [Diabrotica balteata]
MYSVPPQIHPFNFGDEAINSGDLVTATCAVSKGDFPLKIRWTLNGKTVNKFEGVVAANTNKKVSQLTIESATAHHSGEYVCIAENNAGIVKHSAYLNVNVPPQILPFNFGEDSVNSGDVASLQCTVFKGDFPLNITWLHNNRSIGIDDKILISQNGKKVSSLTIESVSEEHIGKYSCLVQNSAGSSVFSVDLNVNVSPQILPFNFGEESVNSGDVASLTCTVYKGDFPLNITWLHKNKTIGYNSGILILQNGKKVSSLTIESVSEDHAGVYTCLAQNTAGSASFSVELNVNVPPIITPFDFGEETVNSGDYTSTQCSVHKGDLPLTITWYHNNRSLTENDGIQITKVGKKASSITIESVKEQHSGTYTCVAKNKAGVSEFSTILSINAIPQILPFNFGEESVNSGDVASLQCTVFKGDLPINITWFHNSKRIEYGDGIVISQVSKKVSSLTIDDVREAHSGNYTCVAQNRAGSSTESTELHINVLPQILHFDFGDSSVNSGDSASTTCNVHKGDLPVNITWSHDNKTVNLQDGILVTKLGKKMSTISIDMVQARHRGVYVCSAENSAGRSSYSAELHVNGSEI